MDYSEDWDSSPGLVWCTKAAPLLSTDIRTYDQERNAEWGPGKGRNWESEAETLKRY